MCCPRRLSTRSLSSSTNLSCTHVRFEGRNTQCARIHPLKRSIPSVSVKHMCCLRPSTMCCTRLGTMCYMRPGTHGRISDAADTSPSESLRTFDVPGRPPVLGTCVFDGCPCLNLSTPPVCLVQRVRPMGFSPERVCASTTHNCSRTSQVPARAGASTCADTFPVLIFQYRATLQFSCIAAQLFVCAPRPLHLSG